LAGLLRTPLTADEQGCTQVMYEFPQLNEHSSKDGAG
jgi:hypothetical protein